MATRTMSVGARSYPVILPSIRDPRLHVAAVIITIHVLGQLGLDFAVSVPQILAAMLTCAVIEVALTFRATRSFVWPASALLTGSGVALILRVVGTPPDDPWTTYGWGLFAAIAGLSLLTKYVIRYRGTHIFNPSNIGLVVAFIVLGASRVEPLDFWWGPLDVWLITAYAVILVGGLLITRRLRLLGLAATFWVALAAGLGLLALSGHCMTANWAFAPVCGVDFWRVIVFSPEVMIFLFFMITDPKTVPAGRVGRVAFGLLVAIASVLLVAPQTDEFGAKVGLLAGLVVACLARPLIDRFVPEPGSDQDSVRMLAARLMTGGRSGGMVRGAARLGLVGLATLAVGIGIVAAGAPARGVVAVNVTEALSRLPTEIDPSTLPAITVGQDVVDFDHELAGSEMPQVLLALAQNLELENQALLRRDETILPLVAHGDRLVEMQERLQETEATGEAQVAHYQFATVDVSLLVPFGAQEGLSLGLAAEGTVVTETYDASGALTARDTSPFELTFAMRRATGDRWLLVGVLPTGSGP